MFNAPWADIPNMHIKTYALEINKHQSVTTKIVIPCDNALNVVTCVTSMYACGVFTDLEIVKWENGGSNGQEWVSNAAYFNNIWMD